MPLNDETCNIYFLFFIDQKLIFLSSFFFLFETLPTNPRMSTVVATLNNKPVLELKCDDTPDFSEWISNDTANTSNQYPSNGKPGGSEVHFDGMTYPIFVDSIRELDCPFLGKKVTVVVREIDAIDDEKGKGGWITINYCDDYGNIDEQFGKFEDWNVCVKELFGKFDPSYYD